MCGITLYRDGRGEVCVRRTGQVISSPPQSSSQNSLHGSRTTPSLVRRVLSSLETTILRRALSSSASALSPRRSRSRTGEGIGDELQLQSAGERFDSVAHMLNSAKIGNLVNDSRGFSRPPATGLASFLQIPHPPSWSPSLIEVRRECEAIRDFVTPPPHATQSPLAVTHEETTRRCF